MEKPLNNDEPLFTPRQVATMATEPVEPFLQLITSYLLTTWALVTRPDDVLVSIFNSSPQAVRAGGRKLSNRIKFWLMASWAEKKKLWQAWFSPAIHKPYANSWAYLRTTVALFFLVALFHNGLVYLFPSRFKKAEVAVEYKQAMAKARRQLEESLHRPLTRDELKEFNESVAGQVKRLNAQKTLRENDTIKKPAFLIMAFLLCYCLAKPLTKWHKLPIRELLAASRYGLSLALLTYIISQLLTSIPVISRTPLGDILFFVCAVAIPSYYIARYVKRHRPQSRFLLNLVVLEVSQVVVSTILLLVYLDLGAEVLTYLQHFHDTH